MPRRDRSRTKWSPCTARASKRVEGALDRALAEWYFEIHAMPQIRAVEDVDERKLLLEKALKEAGLARR